MKINHVELDHIKTTLVQLGKDVITELQTTGELVNEKTVIPVATLVFNTFNAIERVMSGIGLVTPTELYQHDTNPVAHDDLIRDIATHVDEIDSHSELYKKLFDHIFYGDGHGISNYEFEFLFPSTHLKDKTAHPHLVKIIQEILLDIDIISPITHYDPDDENTWDPPIPWPPATPGQVVDHAYTRKLPVKVTHVRDFGGLGYFEDSTVGAIRPWPRWIMGSSTAQCTLGADWPIIYNNQVCIVHLAQWAGISYQCFAIQRWPMDADVPDTELKSINADKPEYNKFYPVVCDQFSIPAATAARMHDGQIRMFCFSTASLENNPTPTIKILCSRADTRTDRYLFGRLVAKTAEECILDTGIYMNVEFKETSRLMAHHLKIEIDGDDLIHFIHLQYTANCRVGDVSRVFVIREKADTGGVQLLSNSVVPDVFVGEHGIPEAVGMSQCTWNREEPCTGYYLDEFYRFYRFKIVFTGYHAIRKLTLIYSTGRTVPNRTRIHESLGSHLIILQDGERPVIGLQNAILEAQYTEQHNLYNFDGECRSVAPSPTEPGRLIIYHPESDMWYWYKHNLPCDELDSVGGGYGRWILSSIQSYSSKLNSYDFSFYMDDSTPMERYFTKYALVMTRFTVNDTPWHPEENPLTYIQYKE